MEQVLTATSGLSPLVWWYGVVLLFCTVPFLLLLIVLPILSLLVPKLVSKYAPNISVSSFSLSLISGITVTNLELKDSETIYGIMTIFFPSAGLYSAPSSTVPDVTKFTIDTLKLR